MCSVLHILEYCSIHGIKINSIFKVYEEPEEVAPKEEEPVPVAEEEPEAPPPAGTRQHPVPYRKIHPWSFVSIIYLL